MIIYSKFYIGKEKYLNEINNFILYLLLLKYYFIKKCYFIIISSLNSNNSSFNYQNNYIYNEFLKKIIYNFTS